MVKDGRRLIAHKTQGGAQNLRRLILGHGQEPQLSLSVPPCHSTSLRLFILTSVRQTGFLLTSGWGRGGQGRAGTESESLLLTTHAPTPKEMNVNVRPIRLKTKTTQAVPKCGPINRGDYRRGPWSCTKINVPLVMNDTGRQYNGDGVSFSAGDGK